LLASLDIDKIKAGDTLEFRSLFISVYPKLLAFACRFVDEDIAKDLVQDVFAMYWEKKDTIDASNIRGYLYKCVQHKSLNFLKHESVVHNHQAAVQIAEARIASFNAHLKNNDTWQQLVARDLKERVEESLSKLPPRAAETFRLCFFHDLSHKQAAEMMNVSPRTIEAHIRHAVTFLRQDLRDLFLMILFLAH
jgi:RNA polymerase sigma-70 factor (family 1)